MSYGFGRYILEQWLAAKLAVPVFVNIVLLEHSHIHFMMTEINSCDRDHLVHKV